MPRIIAPALKALLGLSLLAGLSACPSENAQETQTETKTETNTMTSTETSASPAAASPAAALTGHAEAGGKVFMAKTCATCHTITALKATGTIGPKLDGIGTTAGTRKPGTTAEAYIHESIEQPAAFLVPNYQNMMPALRASMSDQEYADLVAYLLSLKS